MRSLQQTRLGAKGRTVLLSSCLGGFALLASAHAAAAQDDKCAALAQPGLFPNTTVGSAKMVAADLAKKLPAFCEVTATLSPAAGSRIGVIYRLPENWNGKLVGYGGGGWAGNVRLETAAAGLAAGYAAAQTDGGHPSANAGDTSWVAPGGKPDEVALTDFAHRAVHTMTTVGKQVVAQYYGRPQDKAYFQGCSTGGRMALMEAQRYPDDYDGIVAGAPVYSLRVQAAEIWRDKIFTPPGAGITPDQAKAVNDAVLAQCDAQDGLKDGVIADPRACQFDPVSVQCKTGETGGQCLTPPQVEAFRRAYTTYRDGRTVTIYPLMRGSELAWPTSINTAGDPSRKNRDLGLRAPMFGDPEFDFASFDPVRDTTRARAGAFAKYYEAVDPDLAPFLSHGGKLLLWHGFSDPLPSPAGTIDYYEQAKAASGAKVGKAKADASIALFMAPGVYHCGGGPGADRFDLIAAMDQWISQGQPPQRILATKANASISRPLCPYPAMPRYSGAGDANDEKSFVCR